MNRTFSDSIYRFFCILLVAALMAISALADIPEPPLLIYGSLRNGDGMEITSGGLQFEFTPSGGGQAVRIDAIVGSLSEGINFIAEVLIESEELSDPSEVLQQGAGYTPAVEYDDTAIADPQLTSPLTASRGEVVGPIAYVVTPTGGLVSVSGDINFGIVKQGEYTDRSFTVSNPGTEAVNTNISLLSGDEFHLIDDDGIAQSEIDMTLDPGEVRQIGVRFEPTVVAPGVTDTFQVAFDGDLVERTVTGVCSSFSPDDINEDGVIDYFDIWLICMGWQYRTGELYYEAASADIDGSGKVDHDDLMMLLERNRP